MTLKELIEENLIALADELDGTSSSMLPLLNRTLAIFDARQSDPADLPHNSNDMVQQMYGMSVDVKRMLTDLAPMTKDQFGTIHDEWARHSADLVNLKPAYTDQFNCLKRKNARLGAGNRGHYQRVYFQQNAYAMRSSSVDITTVSPS